MKPADRYAHEMDAQAYWRSFTVTVHFTEPITLVGTLAELSEQHDRNRDGTTTRHPRLIVRDDEGQAYLIVARQARLVAELVRVKAVVGDEIKITYSGATGPAAPGMSATKEFRVAVRKPRAEARTEQTEGTSGSENVPLPGQNGGKP